MPTPSAVLLEARDIQRVSARSGVLLHPVSFVLRAGDRVVISGGSGAGKTVFLRALAALDPLQGGELKWRGAVLTADEVPGYRAHVLYLAQRAARFEGDVDSSLREPFRWTQHRRRKYEVARASALFEAFGREPGFLRKLTRDLSGGEAQIVALVRALLLEPSVLLLDEPTASLDPDSAGLIERYLLEWVGAPREEPRAVVWVSHNPAQILRVGARRLVFEGGRAREESL